MFLIYVLAFSAIIFQLGCCYIAYHLNGRLGRYMLFAFILMAIRRVAILTLIPHTREDAFELALAGALTLVISLLLFFGLRRFAQKYGSLSEEVLRLRMRHRVEIEEEVMAIKEKYEVDSEEEMKALDESQREVKEAIAKYDKQGVGTPFHRPTTA